MSEHAAEMRKMWSEADPPFWDMVDGRIFSVQIIRKLEVLPSLSDEEIPRHIGGDAVEFKVVRNIVGPKAQRLFVVMGRWPGEDWIHTGTYE